MELIRVQNSLTLVRADKQKAAETALGKLTVRLSIDLSLGLSISLSIGLFISLSRGLSRSLRICLLININNLIYCKYLYPIRKQR